MSVTSVWIGAVTESTALVVTKVTGGSVRVAVRRSGSAGVQYFGPIIPTGEGVARVPVTGLQPNTRYTYQVEVDGVEDETFPGTFKTFPIPGTRASFSYGMGTCAGASATTPGVAGTLAANRMSNSPIFETMRQQANQEDWLFFAHGGDMHYYDLGSNNHGIVGGGSLTNYRRAYDDVLLQPNQHRLYRNVSLAYVWDDHDYGPNDSDGTIPGRDNACQVYREKVPHYALDSGTGGIYQTWQVGRVKFIASDVRSYRSPNSDPQSQSKTMLGAEQKAWMEQVLLADDGTEALVWLMPSQWISSSHADSWLSFQHERDEMVQMFGDTGWLNRMCINSGDAHALSIETGTSNQWGHFPVYQFAAIDAAGSAGPPTDTGPNLPGPLHYGTMDVRDDGHTISVVGTGWDNGNFWRSHTWYAQVDRRAVYLDYSAGRISPPFEPTDDDQRIVNDVTAKRIEGGQARHEVTEGPMSVHLPPEGVGRYDQSIDLNVAHDSQLAGQAGWRTHLGTVDESRYPRIRIDLTKQTDIRGEVTELDSGDKITIDNTPPWLPPEPIEAMVEGYDEELSLFSWNMVFNASPASPYDVGVVDDVPEGAAPAGRNRADTGGSRLVHMVSDEDTEFVVLTVQDKYVDTNARWINSTGSGELHPGEFPFDVRTDGEVVSVEASESFSYDDFDRTESNGWGTSQSGHLWTGEGGAASERSVSGGSALMTLPTTTDDRFMLLGTESFDDFDVRWTAGVGAMATGGSLASSLVFRYLPSGDHYRLRAHFTAAGNVVLSMTTPAGQVEGNQVSGFQYSPGEMFNFRVRMVGQRLRARVWPTSIEEPQVWHLDRTATDGLIANGIMGFAAGMISGNTNTNLVYTYQDFEVWNPQRFTVERSLNTVERAHEAGVSIALDRPAVAGL